MSRWTPVRSVLLSRVLDDVVGTEETIQIRRDLCGVVDCIRSNSKFRAYYTGSRAEGLDLPGSDDDFMFDINDEFHIQVTETMRDAPRETERDVFVMSTENVPPCFVMLRCVRKIRSRHILNACQGIASSLFLSSYLFLQNFVSALSYRPDKGITIARQGPSIEGWDPFMDKSESGNDRVLSIHCPFWPDAAREWRMRPRQFGWPCPIDMKTIFEFGFHLVPICHPNSNMNNLEWRISFSVAERTLVWSFNHVQIQCYAVLKIILKEFINPNCSPPCRVLCSYFIKTFLFNLRKEIRLFGVRQTLEKFWCSYCVDFVIVWECDHWSITSFQVSICFPWRWRIKLKLKFFEFLRQFFSQISA